MVCESGGEMEIFLDPPNAPRPTLVVGESPLGRALTILGRLLGFRVAVTALGGHAGHAAGRRCGHRRRGGAGGGSDALDGHVPPPWPFSWSFFAANWTAFTMFT